MNKNAGWRRTGHKEHYCGSLTLLINTWHSLTLHHKPFLYMQLFLDHPACLPCLGAFTFFYTHTAFPSNGGSMSMHCLVRVRYQEKEVMAQSLVVCVRPMWPLKTRASVKYLNKVTYCIYGLLIIHQPRDRHYEIANADAEDIRSVHAQFSRDIDLQRYIDLRYTVESLTSYFVFTMTTLWRHYGAWNTSLELKHVSTCPGWQKKPLPKSRESVRVDPCF